MQRRKKAQPGAPSVGKHRVVGLRLSLRVCGAGILNDVGAYLLGGYGNCTFLINSFFLTLETSLHVLETVIPATWADRVFLPGFNS